MCDVLYQEQSKNQKECALLMLQRLEEFLSKRNSYVGWIEESIEFLKLIYRKRIFTNIDQLTYKVERETLLNLFGKIKQLYTDYKDVLMKYPDEFGHDVIQEASTVLKRAPSILKVCYVAPVLNTVDEVERVFKVKAPLVRVVDSKTIEKHLNVIVKKPSTLFVVPKQNSLKTPKAENFSPHQPRSVECKIDRLCRVFSKEKPKTFTKICGTKILKVSNQTTKASIPKLSSKPDCIMKSVRSETENCSSELSNVVSGYESGLIVMNAATIVSSVIKVSKLNITFLCWKFYNRVSLRMFWFYFLFADFSFVAFFVCSGTSFLFIVLFLFVGKVSLFVVKIGILTVGSVNAVLALICLFHCVIV